LPRGSKRRLFVRLLKDFILHPIIFLKKLKPRTVKNFFATLKREGTEGINYKLNNLLIHNQANPIIIEELPTNKDITDYQPLTFKAESTPLVSIIIPVYNQFEYTYNCLKSILKNSGDISYEIIIADDCSADLTTKIEQIGFLRIAIMQQGMLMENTYCF
jgi:cellulose synthase/poly-beta-1,6-N-acetylglucosamine synthase-like glycosyltransferase